ncbi:MAG: response regulator transcription factor [Anaerolineae bacterium]|nr:response regulator transcription factor [Anaerolineae bacterium]
MMRVLIVDKLRLFSNTLKVVLQRENDMRVVGCASTVEEALHQMPHCDVVLVNTGSEEDGAVDLVRAITSRDPAIKVLVVGITEMSDQILEYVEAGASGYILKEDSIDLLLEKVRAAPRDEAVVSPQMAAQLMSRLAELTSIRSRLWVAPDTQMRRFNELTQREQEVLGLLGKGFSNQEIAERLYIEHGTVKNHVHRILKKLNASNRHEAAAAYMMRLKHEGAAGVFAG